MLILVDCEFKLMKVLLGVWGGGGGGEVRKESESGQGFVLLYLIGVCYENL